MKTNSQMIRNKASKASTLEEAQRLEAIAAYEASLEAEAVELDLEPLNFEDEDEVVEQPKALPMIEQVYNALVVAEEGGGYVYLDNINLSKLGITEQQFSGYCSALAKQSRYEPTNDKCFGIVKL